MNPFSRAVDSLGRIAAELRSPLAIVGGLAAIRHGAEVTTADIDIVVSSTHLEDVLSVATRHGFTIVRQSPAGWHRLLFRDREGDVTVEVVPAGGKSPRDPAYAPSIPEPTALGVAEGVGYASFGPWVAMKLVAGRDKDRYHIRETLKHASQQDIAAAVEQLRQLAPIYLGEFERLLRAAEDEDQADW